ncbi:hypothetical protein L1887_11145 [Cichorium endivia]|nr:hypothetical protein L1887_11145 [Cichorium endivia]
MEIEKIKGNSESGLKSVLKKSITLTMAGLDDCGGGDRAVSGWKHDGVKFFCFRSVFSFRGRCIEFLETSETLPTLLHFHTNEMKSWRRLLNLHVVLLWDLMMMKGVELKEAEIPTETSGWAEIGNIGST